MTRDKGDRITCEMFPDLLSAEQVEEQVAVRPLRHPIWSHHKAKLIERYLYFFVMVTKHGTYIDGFAGPQSPDHQETWSAKRVIESRPRYLRNFFLCELDDAKVDALTKMWESQPPRASNESKRSCEILSGDFNALVERILGSGVITEKEAAFALLDQRTFECHWATVQKLAEHKRVGNKIELFYFLAVKWLHRSLGGITTPDGIAKVNDWWGSGSWSSLASMKQLDVAARMCDRFRTELGYRHALPFPIYESENGEGSIMYYMIHATDHDDAPGLMWRAYNQATQPDDAPEQAELKFPASSTAVTRP